MEFGPESAYSRKFLVELEFGDRWRQGGAGGGGLYVVTMRTMPTPNLTAYPFLLSVPTMLSGSSVSAHSPKLHTGASSIPLSVIPHMQLPGPIISSS